MTKIDTTDLMAREKRRPEAKDAPREIATLPPEPTEQVDRKAQDLVRSWLKEIEAANDREKDWKKKADELVKKYEADQTGVDYQFNILYSNTETLLPALYNATPTPQVKQRYASADPVNLAVQEVSNSLLKYLQDSGSVEFPTFDELLTQAVLEALVPGRGVTRFKYDVELADEASEPLEGPDSDLQEPVQPAQRVQSEWVCGEMVPWNQFRHGFAKTWAQTPWVAIEHIMDRAELVENFGEVGNRVKLSKSDASHEHDDKTTKQIQETVSVHEIWDKRRKQVLFISEGYPDGPLRGPLPDPLGLSGFFPMPKPLQFLRKISHTLPVPLYNLYEEQAKELNIVTKRINKIVSAMKVRGMYDSTISGIDKVLSGEDNTLTPAENVATMQQGQSLEKAIWLMPIEKLINVLQQLTQHRENVKGVIYEIMGISDILRGSSAASETATAQSIKDKWGGIRVKRMQKEVARYARDCLRIMLELGGGHFSQQTLQQITGLDFPTAQIKQALQQRAQQVQASGQQIPPEAQQQAQALFAKPAWEDIQQVLQSEITRNYRVDIETNSTVDIESSDDKESVSEFLNAFGQFVTGVAPLVEKQVLPFDAMKTLMLAVTRKFRFGEEVESSLTQMQEPAPPKDPNAGAQALEQQKSQALLAQIQAKGQAEQTREQAKQATEQQKAQIEIALKQQDLAIAREELEIKKVELALDRQRLEMELERMQTEHMIKVRELMMQPQETGQDANS